MSRTEKADQLIADQLKSELPNVVIGREIIVLQQTSSTNDAILQVISPQEAAVSSPASITELFSRSIKPPGAGSAATAGNQLREKGFGFPSYYDPRSISAIPGGSPFGQSKQSPTSFVRNGTLSPRLSCRTTFSFSGAK